MKPARSFPLLAAVALAVPTHSLAEPIADWKVLIGTPATSGLDTDHPTFGDDTPEGMAAVTVAGRFGTAGAPRPVTLEVGETLVVSAMVRLTGGLNLGAGYRFGVGDDGGQFEASSAENWSGGWNHSVSWNLYAARTDGHFLSQYENAVDLNAAKTTIGTLEGNSARAYSWSMRITRDSETTVDVASCFKGGDPGFSETMVANDVPASGFTYTAIGVQSTGFNQLDKLEIIDAEFVVIPAGPITYVDAVEGTSGNTFATGGTPDDTSWESGLDSSASVENQWTKRTDSGGNADTLFQASHFLGNGDDMPELTTRIGGLADGTYAVWAFYWDQVESDSMNWTLSAGLTSGELIAYSSPGEPAVNGTRVARVFNAADLPFENAVVVEDGFDGTTHLRNLFGVYLGQAVVSGGTGTLDVHLDNLGGNGSANRVWYDGVGYQRISAPGAALRITSFEAVAAGLWEVMLAGEPATAYEFRASAVLDFNPGTLVENLTQGDAGDPGTIGGPNGSVVTTDGGGMAVVRVNLTGNANFIRAQSLPPILSADFEDDGAGFTAIGSPNDWEWGLPASDNNFNLVLDAANGGSSGCWGTNLGDGGTLSGVIDPSAESVLRSPDIDLTDVPAATLEFAAAYDVNTADTLEVRVRDAATDALLDTIVPPGLPGTSGWRSLGPFGLSAAAGSTVYLEFRYQGTDAQFLGWYIDDVLVRR